MSIIIFIIENLSHAQVASFFFFLADPLRTYQKVFRAHLRFTSRNCTSSLYRSTTHLPLIKMLEKLGT